MHDIIVLDKQITYCYDHGSCQDGGVAVDNSEGVGEISNSTPVK